jgi:hypothetical protein
MGVVGAAWAALSGVVVVEALRLLEVWAILRISPYNLGFLKPVSAGLAAVAASFAVGQAFPGLDPITRVAAQCAATFGPYVAVILLLGLSREDRLLLSRLRRRARLG